MIGIAKTVDEEERNDFGFPSVQADAPHNRGNFHQHVELNKALPWVAFSWFLSGGAIVGLVLMALMLPRLIESSVNEALAGARADTARQVEDARADVRQELADTKALANVGREHARIALAEVQRANAQLEAKHIISPRTH